MRRADRMFQIIQTLRGATAPLTARQLAEELEASPRTIYRDIADLMAQRVPIRGEAGIGYVLDRGYDMPPLMLTPDEIEAAVLGAQWVAARGDDALARGARDLIAKISDVVPTHLRPLVVEAPVSAPIAPRNGHDAIDVARVRSAIRTRTKIRIAYADEHGRPSERTIWPIAVAYFEAVRLIIGWCELRVDFRHFRTDRIVSADFLPDTYQTPTRVLRERWATREQARTRPC